MYYFLHPNNDVIMITPYIEEDAAVGTACSDDVLRIPRQTIRRRRCELYK